MRRSPPGSRPPSSVVGASSSADTATTWPAAGGRAAATGCATRPDGWWRSPTASADPPGPWRPAARCTRSSGPRRGGATRCWCATVRRSARCGAPARGSGRPRRSCPGCRRRCRWSSWSACSRCGTRTDPASRRGCTRTPTRAHRDHDSPARTPRLACTEGATRRHRERDSPSDHRDDLGCAHPGGVGGLVVWHLLALALGLDALAVVLHFALDLRLAPPEHGGDEPGDLLHGADAAVERLDRDPGAAGEEVVQVPGALVRRGVDDLR